MVSDGVRLQAARSLCQHFPDCSSSHTGRTPVAIHNAPRLLPGVLHSQTGQLWASDFHMVKASTAPHFCF